MLAKQTNLEAPTESSSAVSLAGIDDGLGGHEHGVHVDAGTQAGDVDAGADAAGGSERLGDGLDDAAVGVADALLNERGEAAR